jgi:hypothetical protein
MDNVKVGRNKKDDKAKEKYERNGGFSQKHVRLMEAMAEKRTTSGATSAAKPKK